MLGLYVHIPFCAKKCNYCDFYSVGGKIEQLDRYLDALFLEADKYNGMEFETLYVGGGTPSILGARRLETLVQGLSRRLNLEKVSEASIEVNPESATPEFLEAALLSGMKRVSIGVQSLDNDELKQAGRIHDACAALRAIDAAHHCGFDDISTDIIVGLPGQTSESLTATIDQLGDRGLTHVSAYCLSIEDNTPFAVSPPADLIDDDGQAALFEMAVRRLAQQGFRHYEISNFSLPDRECRHNLNYWRGGEYVGLGPSAASHLNGLRLKNSASLEKYLKDPLAIEVEEDMLDTEAKMAEEAMLRLRLLEEGLDLQNLEARYANINADGLRGRLERMIEERMLVKSGDRIRLPSDRVLTSNQVLMHVLS